MNCVRSDSEKAKEQIKQMINRLKRTKDLCDSQYYHYLKSKTSGTVDFCKEIGLITDSEAIMYHNTIEII